MLELLQNYLTINTTHPHPNYAAVVALFKEQALNDGFIVRELALPSGNPVLVITLPGSCPQLRSLALNHHMDVVPADNANEWNHPPFAATMHNGLIIGRGAQDCKGLGVMHYAALRQLKKSGLSVARTIHCILVPDEERGGMHGTKEFVETPLFASLNIGYVLDEGMASGNDAELLIKIAERTPIQIQVTVQGKQGHSSQLFHQNCIHMLNSFLTDVISFHAMQQGYATPDNAGEYLSMHVTSLSASGNALNVIPPKAHATIDLRVPSHMPLNDGIILIKEMLKKNPAISYQVLASSDVRAIPVNTSSFFYQALAQSITANGYQPKPFSFEATTDARFYQHKGAEVIGMTPVTAIPNLHGTNESIAIKDITLGTAIVHTFFHIFCTTPHHAEGKHE